MSILANKNKARRKMLKTTTQTILNIN